MTDIERARQIAGWFSFCGSCTTGNCKECERYKAKEAILTSLEKQISKKPTYLEQPNGYLGLSCKCPDCGKDIPYIVWYGNLKYCPYCSQALDWTKEENEK